MPQTPIDLLTAIAHVVEMKTDEKRRHVQVVATRIR